MNFTREFSMGIGAKELLAQIIGFVAMTLIVLSFQQKTRKGILMMQLIAEAFWVLHFGLIGAYTGMALNILGVVRCYVYANRETKKWANSETIPYIFFTLSIITGILSWTNAYSLLPMAAVCITSFVLWSKKAHIIRYFSYPGCICWLIFNIASGSYAGIVTELFNISSVTVGIIRFDIRKNRMRNMEPA
ncbi:MAG: YgjV family protein [Clostridiales bacterium]|nr:YgjV family protein [Clostridiales bacterium]